MVMNRRLTICLNTSIIFKSILKCFFTIARELFCTEQSKDRLMDFRISSQEGVKLKLKYRCQFLWQQIAVSLNRFTFVILISFHQPFCNYSMLLKSKIKLKVINLNLNISRRAVLSCCALQPVKYYNNTKQKKNQKPYIFSRSRKAKREARQHQPNDKKKGKLNSRCTANVFKLS